MKVISARDRRAENKGHQRFSSYNITDNFLQCKTKMLARQDREQWRLQVLADAGLDDNKTLVGEKAQLAHMALCDAAIEAAERGKHESKNTINMCCNSAGI